MTDGEIIVLMSVSVKMEPAVSHRLEFVIAAQGSQVAIVKYFSVHFIAFKKTA